MIDFFKNGINIPLPRKITLNIGLGVVLFSLLMYFGATGKLTTIQVVGNIMALWIAIFLHELTHLYSARKLGYICDKIELTFWGGFVKPDIENAPKNVIKDEDGKPVYDWRMPLAGPLMNLALGVASWIIIYTFNIQFTEYRDNSFVFFAHINILLLLNLLPVIGFDGWHILRYLLTKYSKKPTKVSMIVGLSCLAIALPYWLFY